MTEDADKPYQAKSVSGRGQVLDDSGRVVLTCGDEASAADYVVLLNEAYRRGYKAGYRDAKKPRSPG